jgi:16S rRNA (guanine966-N2)-methyltransferase
MLRITGGSLRGRRFSGPKGDGTRPTAEKVREALGSVLTSRGLLADARVLDLFAGTGALAFEALSRGAREALLVERDRGAERSIRENARALGLDARIIVRRLDLSGRPEALAAALAGSPPFDLVFADPPYDAIDRVPPLLVALAHAGLLAEGAVAVVEHASRRPPSLPPTLANLAEYRYGDTAVALLARNENPE